MTDSQTRDKAIRLFKYLSEICDLRTKPLQHYRQYERTIWLADIFEDPALLDVEASDGWFSVERVTLPDRPETPTILTDWIEEWDLDDWQSEPQLNSSAELDVTVNDDIRGSYVTKAIVHRSERPLVDEAWLIYKASWQLWKAECERLAPAHSAYTTMFTAYQRAESLGEQFELVLGAGLLTWATPNGDVVRHLVTAPCSMQLVSSTGQIVVGPDDDAPRALNFEQDMVSPEMRPATRDVGDLQERAVEVGDPLNSDGVSELIRSWVNAADPNGEFVDSWDRPSPDENAMVTMSPAICLRKRSQSGRQATYESILKQLSDETVPVPATIEDLVSFTGARLDDNSEDADAWIPPSGEIYFPLASNEQQRNIIRTLGDRRGVVVQGPPGTGKSQTITNLICHSLAMGKRVLVTSHTERALRVLQEKLPDEFERLTVNVVGSGRSGSKDIERSANALLGRMSDPEWDTRRIDERIKLADSNLAQLSEEASDVRHALSEIHVAQSQPVTLSPSHVGLMSDLVERMADEAAELGWVADPVQGQPPFRNDDFAWLVAWQRWVPTADSVQLSWSVPDVENLASPDGVRTTMAALADALEHASTKALTSQLFEGHNEEHLDKLAEQIDRVLSQEEAASRRPGDWATAARADIEIGRDEPWRLIHTQTRTALDECADLGSFGSASPLTCSIDELQRLDHQGSALVAHLASGGSMRRLGRARAVKDAEEFLQLSVDGLPIETLETATEMHRRVTISLAIEQCLRQWDGAVPQNHPTVQHLVGDLQNSLESLDILLSLHDKRCALGELLGLADPEILPGSAPDLLHDVRRQQAAYSVRHLRSTLEDLTSRAVSDVDGPTPHPAIARLVEAVRAEDAGAYEMAHGELIDAAGLANSVDKAAQLATTLRDLAPALHDSLASLEDSQAAQFEAAWNWRVATLRAEELSKGGMASYFERLSALASQRERSVTDLGVQRAWRAAMSTLTDTQASHLKAYQQALQRLGKGTGKRAATNRAEARRHLAECQSAIPAWIMPTYRVAETIRANPGAFDVVIVDEASQSGVEDLFLLWLGKQLIIVGDDKQISPSNVGVRVEDVERLQNEYLSDFALGDVLDISASLFDQAKVRYSGNEWLTEHFRCMPEIIEFSNREVYAPQHRRLHALRQFGLDRLPPLKSTFVPEATEEAKVNRNEADALVKRILACHEDPAYEGKTFGVISLLGPHQAALIEGILFERIGEQAWSSREIRCGDAYAFQGDERDVIFLSMVKAPNQSGRAIAKLGAAGTQQRFNVAASRAKHQMWLFHSVGLEHLNPEGIRAALVRHFVDPVAQDIVGFEGEVDRDIRHDKFDSLFEQRVFLDIRNMGYVVEPQVKVYGKRLDLVVAGSGGKLAVECDGSAFHGPDDFAADVARQQELERVGWTFHRISDVDYYTDHERTMADLRSRLTSMRIFPAGVVPAETQTAATPPATVSDVAVSDSEVSAFDTPIAEAEATATSARVEIEPDIENLPAEPSQPVTEPAAADTPAPSTMAVTWEAAVQSERLAQDDATAPAKEPGLAPVEGGLEPYIEWKRELLPQPLSLTADELASELVKVIAVEGPIQVDLLFGIVNRAAGNKRTGSKIRAALDEALKAAVRSGRVLSDQVESSDAGGVVRSNAQISVRLRTPGNRTLYEYPEYELAELVRHVYAQGSDTWTGETLSRAVLAELGSRTLTRKVTEHLNNLRSRDGVLVFEELLGTHDHHTTGPEQSNDA